MYNTATDDSQATTEYDVYDRTGDYDQQVPI